MNYNSALDKSEPKGAAFSIKFETGTPTPGRADIRKCYFTLFKILLTRSIGFEIYQRPVR
jgi:hypothetical protein